MFVSVTRLRIRSLRFLPTFAWMTYMTKRQLGRASGFVGGKLQPDAHWTFWTVTVWTDERQMKAYRGSQAHGKAMPRLAKWCDEGAYTHWSQDSESVPSMEEAWERLQKDGRLSRVEHPSADHTAKIFPKPRLTPATGLDLKPATQLK